MNILGMKLKGKQEKTIEGLINKRNIKGCIKFIQTFSEKTLTQASKKSEKQYTKRKNKPNCRQNKHTTDKEILAKIFVENEK